MRRFYHIRLSLSRKSFKISVRVQKSPVRSPGNVKRTSKEGMLAVYDKGFLTTRANSLRSLNIRLGVLRESSSLEWNPVGRA